MASTPLQLVLVCFAAREEEGGDACLDAGEGWPPTLGQRNEEKGGPFSPSHGPSHQDLTPAPGPRLLPGTAPAPTFAEHVLSESSLPAVLHALSLWTWDLRPLVTHPGFTLRILEHRPVFLMPLDYNQSCYYSGAPTRDPASTSRSHPSHPDVTVETWKRAPETCWACSGSQTGEQRGSM